MEIFPIHYMNYFYIEVMMEHEYKMTKGIETRVYVLIKLKILNVYKISQPLICTYVHHDVSPHRLMNE